MCDFITSPVGPFPPLPDPVPPFPAPLPAPHPVELIPRPEVIWPRPPFHFRSVRCGCWLLNGALEVRWVSSSSPTASVIPVSGHGEWLRADYPG